MYLRVSPVSGSLPSQVKATLPSPSLVTVDPEAGVLKSAGKEKLINKTVIIKSIILFINIIISLIQKID